MNLYKITGLTIGNQTEFVDVPFGDYNVLVFKKVKSPITITFNQDIEIQYIIVGGGGAGGVSSQNSGGTGGAGGEMKSGKLVLSDGGAVSVRVGDGAVYDSKNTTAGETSTITYAGTTTTVNGGKNGGYPGGGSAFEDANGPLGESNIGNGGNNYVGAFNPTNKIMSRVGGPGGDGSSIPAELSNLTINNLVITHLGGGGGGGGRGNQAGGNGGRGGGGNGGLNGNDNNGSMVNRNGIAGVANTGGGGGGGTSTFAPKDVNEPRPRSPGGNGGSGVIIIYYKRTDVFNPYKSHIPKQSLTNEINGKLKELYQLPGTQVDNAKRQYSATMVAGTVWSVLALSLVYYTYTRV